MKKVIILFFLFFIVSFILADTDIFGGNVSGSWMLRDSPIIVHDNFSIANNDSLYIDEGVQVIFMGNFGITVNGSLFADGTSSNPITFTVSDTSGYSDFDQLSGSWGGIYVRGNNGTVKFKYTTFEYTKDLATNIRATTDSGMGGAVCARDRDVTFEHCIFHHNYSLDQGGAVAILGGSQKSTFLRCDFYQNKTDFSGGAIYAQGSNVDIHICEFHDNYAQTGDGGAICTEGSIINFSSNLFYSNLADLGGAIYISDSDIEFFNNTVSDNTANSAGGGIFHHTSQTIDAYNNILYYNIPEQIYFETSNSTVFKYSDIQDGSEGYLWFGPGCINYTPRFENRPANYRLNYESPCRDNGFPNSDELNIYPYDLDERTRFLYDRIDMGAYEFDQGGSVVNIFADFHADVTEGYQPLGVQFYDETNIASSWYWDFGDGNTSSEKNPFHTYQTAGTYTVTLTASGEAGTDEETKVAYITVNRATHITDSMVSGVWTRDNSPYIIDTDIMVEQFEVLEIEPGVSVLFSDNYNFEVYGTLLAEGTSQDSIYFSVVDTTGYSNDNHLGWGGIHFDNLVYSATETSQLAYCVFEYAKIQGDGGALNINEVADYLSVENCLFRKCKAQNGGAVSIAGGSFTEFNHVFFINNEAYVRGGAIFIASTAQPSFNFCKISHNTAQYGAAIFASQNSEFQVEHTLISKNNMESNGVIALNDVTNTTFTNTTIVDNVSQTNSARTLFLQNSSELTMYNCIIWNPTLVQEVHVESSNLTVNYTDIRGNWDGGISVYDIEPNFRNTFSYKLALLNSEHTAKNPLIDAGNPSDDYSLEPMPNGGRINLGTYGGTSQATYSCTVENNDIDGNEQWDNTEMHVITRDLTVEENATLAIQPGAIIQLTNGHRLHILGSLVANATRGDTIIFTNNYNDTGEDSPWYGILLEFANAQSSTLANILVENALHGVYIQDKNISMQNVKIRFDLNETADKGLAFYGSSDFSLANTEISGYPSGIYFGNSGRDVSTPTLTNVRIRNSSSSSRDDDIGIEISGNVAATIDSCEIEDYTIGIAQSGEAGQTSSPTITNTRIRNSSSSSRTLQTAILLQDVEAPQLTNNTIEGYQTAIKVETTRRDQSTPTITNSRLRNSASSSRNNITNGIYLSGNVCAAIQNNILEDFDTGIKYVGNGEAFRDTPTLANNRIRNSSSSSRDSLLTTGIELQDVINIHVDNDSIVGYQIGIDISNISLRTVSTPTLTNTRIRNSTSSSRDITYGIKMNGNIAGSFTDLRIVDFDYGIYYLGSGEITRDTPTLTNTRIRNSTSSSRTEGIAAIYYENVITSFIDSTLIEEYPIGIKMINNTRTTSTPTLTNTRIRTSPSSSRDINTGILFEGDFNGEIAYNEIVNQDSAIVVRGIGANPTIRQNTIYFDKMENDDEEAVAIYAEDSSNLQIINNTIFLYDFAFISQNATTVLKNIIAYKENPHYEPITISPMVSVSYSDISRPGGDIYPGDGNINENPLFYKAKRGNFNLRTGSPCIDSGDPAILDDDGSQSDMGRYFQPNLIDFDSQSMFGAVPHHNVQFREISTGFNENNTTWYWDIDNDGDYDIQGRNPSYDFTQSGLYTVKLKVVKATTQDSLIKENFIVIQDQQLPAPENVTISVRGDDINLSWDPITWPDNSRGRYYLVYKSNRPGGDFEYLDYTNDVPNYQHINAASLNKAFYKIIAYEGTLRSLQLYIQNLKKLTKQKNEDKK